jgi:hypothetical protein
MSTPLATPWEIAKPLLIADIIHGRIPATMKPRNAHNFRDEYKLVDKVNFRSNLQNLRSGLDVLYNKADVDNHALAHDHLLHPVVSNPPGFNYPCWDGSEAKKQLKIDVNEGRHLLMQPKVPRATKRVYQLFPPDVFQKHIH